MCAQYEHLLSQYLYHKKASGYIASVVFFCRVFGAIVFGAMAVGQMAHFAPDAGKATAAANRLFFLLDREPAMDQSDSSGQKPVSQKLI